MNPSTIATARKLFMDVRERMKTRSSTVEVVVAPPFPYIAALSSLSPSKRIALGAQHAFPEASGAHTGEVSIAMLKSIGVSHVIVGHSERRAAGQTDTSVQEITAAVLKQKMHAIVCVGETKRDAQGSYFTTVETQLRTALTGLPKSQLKYLAIAYEPVWAIGTGNTATPADAQEMKLFIQKVIADLFGRRAVNIVRILYGGSVKRGNAEALLTEGTVDGFLVGGASLRASEFADIIATARTYARTHTA